MEPETANTSNVPVRRYCGLSNHILKTPNTMIRDPKILHFSRNINPELRHDTPICTSCFVTLEEIYKLKKRNARAHQARKQAETISDVSSNQRQDVTLSSYSSTAAASKPQTPVPVDAISSEDDMPTASAAAAQKLNRSNPAAQYVPQLSESSDDDTNSNLSLNAVNGTRLPHLQPITQKTPDGAPE